MNKLVKPGRLGAEQRHSKIRRDPPPPARPAGIRQTVLPDVAEREAWTVVVGILLFAVAIAIIVFAVGNYIGR